MYALLLFGGPVTVDHIKGGLTIGNKEAFVKLKAWPRIGVLANQLRCVTFNQAHMCLIVISSSQLLDLLLANCIDEGSSLSETQNHPVIRAILSLLDGDGMSK